jgi:hypothetical protein
LRDFWIVFHVTRISHAGFSKSYSTGFFVESSHLNAPYLDFARTKRPPMINTAVIMDEVGISLIGRLTGF